MAITLNNKSVQGIFSHENIDITTIQNNEETADVEISVSGAKDPLYIIFDLTRCILPVKAEVLNADGKTAASVELVADSFAVLPITTFNNVNKDGKVKLKLTMIGAIFSADAPVRIGSFSHVTVINH